MPEQEIKNYKVYFYGGNDGWENARSLITLIGNSNNPVGFIRFYEQKMPPAADTNQNNMITMYLPSAEFANVIDILRNEKPLYINFKQDRGLLATGPEIVGEGEAK